MQINLGCEFLTRFEDFNIQLTEIKKSFRMFRTNTRYSLEALGSIVFQKNIHKEILAVQAIGRLFKATPRYTQQSASLMTKSFNKLYRQELSEVDIEKERSAIIHQGNVQIDAIHKLSQFYIDLERKIKVYKDKYEMRYSFSFQDLKVEKQIEALTEFSKRLIDAKITYV